MSKDYRYDAFISYRHVEPDRSTAIWLHRALESYRVPKELRKEGFPSKLKRIFRDEEELPASADLSSEINSALEESRFLIVVCSPRILESVWCDAEVIKFRELGRHNKIIALLIEGEPETSFLPALTEIREIEKAEDGTQIETVRKVEPLAADIRHSRNETQRELKQLAKLRILACLLGCKFDDLRRRELRRKQKLRLQFTVLMAMLLISFSILTLWALSERDKAVTERDKAEKLRLLAEQRKNQAENSAYMANIGLAHQKFKDRNYEASSKLLLACPPELRKWEWGYLWNAQNRKKNDFKLQGNACLSHDGQSIITCGAKTIREFSLEGKEIRAVPITVQLTDLTAIKGNSYLGCSEKGLVQLDKDFKTIKTFKPQNGLTYAKCAVNKKGWVAAVDITGEITVVSEDLKLIKKIQTECYQARAIHMSQKHLIIGGREVNIISLEDGKTVYKKDLGNINCVHISEDGKIAFAAGHRYDITVINLENLKESRIKAYAEGQPYKHQSINFLKTIGNHMITATRTGIIRIFNLMTEEDLALFRAKGPYLLHKGLLYSSSGTFSTETNRTLHIHESFTSDSSFNSKTLETATAGGGGKVHIHNSDFTRIVKTLNHKQDVQSVDFDSEGKRIVTSSEDGSVRIWKKNGELELEKKISERTVFSARFIPGSADIITGGGQKLLLISSGGSILKTAMLKANRTYDIQCSPAKLIACTDGQEIAVFSTDLKELYRLTGHTGDVMSLDWNNDGTELVSGSNDGSIFLWDIKSRKKKLQLKGHGDSVFSAKFFDHSRVLSGSGDGTLKCWNSLTGQEIFSLNSGQPIHTVNFAGDKVITGHYLGAVKIWNGIPAETLKEIK